MRTFEPAREATPAGDDFAEVYQSYLTPVWRYVRSRVGGYHDSQDVTAEVFTRAWRSWPSYNPARGAVAAWLFRIAQRTVADWHRRSRREHAWPSSEPPVPDPAVPSISQSLDAALLDQEVLIGLGWALGRLSERDRNCVALRFAGGLKIGEVAEVLGVSTGAAKMALSRALTRLADSMAVVEEGAPAEAVAPAALDEMIEELVLEGSPLVSSERLQELIVHLTASHEAPLPSELPSRVAACIACAGKARRPAEARPADRSAESRWSRLLAVLGLSPLTGVSWVALAPICLACTVPVFATAMLSLGFGLELTLGLHYLALLTSPVVFWVLWRHFRRHHDRVAVWIGIAGALFLVAHFSLHLVPDEGDNTLFTISDQLGAGLLMTAIAVDWRAMRNWLIDQRDRLAALAPSLVATEGVA